MDNQDWKNGKIPTTVYDDKGNPIDTRELEHEMQQAEQTAPTTAPQAVYVMRPHEFMRPEITDDMRQKHVRSQQSFPYLNLSEGEYILSVVRRHVIGLIRIWAIVLLVAALLSVGIFILQNNGGIAMLSGRSATPWPALFLLGVIVLVFLGGVMATSVYDGNKFFLTNESVMQIIQISLFSKKVQTISLGNIEDASFRQSGILQTLLNYGSIRLSTEGDETTYRFQYVSNPSHEITLLNTAIEAFKNGRPVDTDYSARDNHLPNQVRF